MSDFRSLTAPEIVVDPPGPKVRELMNLSGLRRYTQPLMDESQGIFIKDPDGNIFIDFISGRCVTNIGYSHPKLVKALQTQAAKGTHGLTEHRLKLNEKISEITPGDFKKRIFYAQSGSTTRARRGWDKSRWY